jgi:sulfur carrier protein ThiS
MKNSGSLRYFTQRLVDSLHKYEDRLARLKLREESEAIKLESKIIPFVQTIINYEFVYLILRDETLETLPERVYVTLKDQAGKDLLNNYSIEIKTLIERRIFLYDQLKSEAIEILRMLNSKYHLE